MPDTIERSTCPTCGRPTFRYVIVRPRKSPGDTVTERGWWLHENDHTFACDQRHADG